MRGKEGDYWHRRERGRHAEVPGSALCVDNRICGADFRLSDISIQFQLNLI